MASIERELAAAVSSEVVTPTAQYLADETEGRGLRGRADAVALPRNAEEAAEVVAWCYAHGVPVVLLAHQPKQVTQAREAGVALQISGHTHGGQIWPFHLLVRLDQPTLSGLSRHGTTQLYNSRGTGFWGPPFRIFAPSEITLLTLRRAS